jgi:hypothetical protein
MKDIADADYAKQYTDWHKEGRYSCRSICSTTEEGQRFVVKEIYGAMPPLRVENYWGEKMNCCNANGDCTQGRDCPIRKQRVKETNDAYIQSGGWGKVADPYAETVGSVKGLIAFIAVTAALTLLAFLVWGK